MDDSKFNLWRATFSFCFVDGFLSPEENQFIEEKLASLSFTPEQKKILLDDLRSRPAIDQLLPLITKPADRGILINNIRLLSRIDNLSPNEKAKIEELLGKIMGKIDLQGAHAEVELAARRFENKTVYTNSILERLLKG